MKDYKIEFEVVDRSIYYAIVEAESPQETLRIWRDDPNQYDSEPDYTIECDDLVDSAECIGEYVDFFTDEKHTGSSLQRYAEPIKLK